MGLPASPWYDGYFSSKLDIYCSTIACRNLPLASLHQIGYTVYIPTDLAINTALEVDTDINLLGAFTSTYENVEPPHVCNTIYLSAPFVGLFLDWYLTPVEA